MRTADPLATNAPANYQVTFRIYTAGTGGSSIWSELQIVTVDRGQFSVVLGEGTATRVNRAGVRPALSQVFTNVAASDLYMEIQESRSTVCPIPYYPACAWSRRRSPSCPPAPIGWSPPTTA